MERLHFRSLFFEYLLLLLQLFPELYQLSYGQWRRLWHISLSDSISIVVAESPEGTYC